ncbi:DUF1702 family protein [Dactylosporangium sp. CA-139066]|uniref:DUF1702 family protein n=1 Tax=Dactylosporangium sp. CA-139066 TaxID=3239930 RepID=UPI003D8F010E
MPGPWLTLRRRVLTPDVSDTDLAKRGFRIGAAAARTTLQDAGRSFVGGYAAAAGTRSPAGAEALLEQTPAPLRGFAYEGAAMAYAVMDGLRLGRDGVARFLAGPGAAHVYMVHVGAGWALGRLPRWRWRAVFPRDPLLRWLALDGYGFHQAYFRTARYVRDRHEEDTAAWPVPGLGGYGRRAIDQGIGRALWFVECADVDAVAATVAGFPARRHQDLYGGVGLAATYAGGVGEDALNRLWEHAGAHRPAVAQGAAFAAKARERAGLVTPHTELATAVLCGLSAAAAAKLCDETLAGLPDGPEDGERPAYARWRERIAGELRQLGRC